MLQITPKKKKKTSIITFEQNCDFCERERIVTLVAEIIGKSLVSISLPPTWIIFTRRTDVIMFFDQNFDPNTNMSVVGRYWLWTVACIEEPDDSPHGALPDHCGQHTVAPPKFLEFLHSILPKGPELFFFFRMLGI